jgi:hypothetical protein
MDMYFRSALHAVDMVVVNDLGMRMAEGEGEGESVPSTDTVLPASPAATRSRSRSMSMSMGMVGMGVGVGVEADTSSSSGYHLVNRDHRVTSHYEALGLTDDEISAATEPPFAIPIAHGCGQVDEPGE